MKTRFKEQQRPVDPRVHGTQAELNGLVIRGGVPDQHEPSGAYIAMTELDGWWGPPGSSGETTARTLAHGGWDNRAYWLPRYFTIAGIIWGDTDREVEAGIDAVAAAIPLDTRAPFVLQRHGVPHYVMARLEGDPEFTWDGGEVAEFDIQLSATDYRKIRGRGPTEGRGVYGPVYGNGSIIEIRAGGTAPPNVEIVIAGAAIEPSLTDLMTGESMWLNGSLLGADTLSVNLNTRLITAGGSNRGSWRRGRFLTPARNMRIRLSGNAVGSSTSLQIYTQDAYR